MHTHMFNTLHSNNLNIQMGLNITSCQIKMQMMVRDDEKKIC